MVLDIYKECNADDGCHERWKRWELHRQMINSILDEQIFSAASIKDAAILGAGRCEDIDLKFLLSNVESLTLVDYDYHSMEKAFERQQLSSKEKDKVILRGDIEFTGLYSEDTMKEITNKIKIKEKPESVIQFIKGKLNAVNRQFNDLLENNQYSLVISGAVHSQLVVPYTGIAVMDAEYLDELVKEAGNVADQLAENFNRSLLSLLKPKGWLFSYFDVMELSDKNNTLQYESIISTLAAQKDYATLNEIICQYGGVAGARHGFEHLRGLAEKFQPDEKAWVWNFRDNKKYYVRSLCFNKV
ncbi:MAG: hypothetical protein E7222_11690 [Clostridiales bacterium]|nr:hypothetical protein [Clostridiales bacterium]